MFKIKKNKIKINYYQNKQLTKKKKIIIVILTSWEF